MHRAFCATVKDPEGNKTFITFGQFATVNDIMEVFDEEGGNDNKSKICDFKFFESSSKKGLAKDISEWRAKSKK